MNTNKNKSTNYKNIKDDFNVELANKTDLYSSISENSLIGIIIINDQSDVIFANKHFSELSGYSNKEIINSKFYKYLSKESRDKVIKIFKSRQEGKKAPSKYQISLIRKNGEERLFQLNASIIKTKENRVQTIVHLFDITEEKKNQDLLKEQNKLNLLRSQIWKKAAKISQTDKYKIIQELLEIIGKELQVSRASYFEFDNSNNNYTVITQWHNKDIKPTTDATISKDIVNYFKEYKCVDIPNDLDNIIKNKAIILIVNNYVKNNFKKYNLKNFIIVKIDDSDKPKNLLSFENCISDRKWSDLEKNILNELASIIDIKLSQINSRLELKKSEKKYRSIIDNSLEGFYIVQDNKIQFCNQVLADIYNYKKPDDLIGTEIKSLIVPESRDLVEQKISEKITKQKNTHYEFLGLRKDGSKFYAESLGTNIIYNGKAAIQGTMRDISKRKEIERKLQKTTEELKDLNNTKDKFFSIIAHDLKNPFNVILGFSELLVNEFNNFSHDEIYDMAQNIYNASKSNFELLENLLQWSRVQMERIKFEPDYFALEDVVNKNLNLVKSKASEKKIKLISGVSPNIFAFADINMVSTIIRNLLSNALKFTNENDNIYINARKVKDYVRIDIIDTGIGIKEKNIKKLFKSDSNITTTGTANEQGTGLGLILCKEFVEKNNGDIFVKSTLGKGSSFSFTLPASDEK